MREDGAFNSFFVARRAGLETGVILEGSDRANVAVTAFVSLAGRAEAIGVGVCSKIEPSRDEADLARTLIAPLRRHLVGRTIFTNVAPALNAVFSRLAQ